MQIKDYDQTSNPADKPDEYVYLVHAFNPMNEEVAIFNMQLQLAALDKGKGLYKSNDVDLLTQPEKIHERLTVSCSLIDNNHRGTWGDAGLVLRLKSGKRPLAASHTDMGSIPDPRMLDSYRTRHLPSPEEILRKTSKTGYNEVLVEGGDVEIIGVFTKITSKSKELDPSLSDQVRHIAYRLNVPVVNILNYNPYEKNMVKTDDLGKVKGIQFEGSLYKLDTTSPEAFIKIGEDYQCWFTSPDELQKILTYAFESGIAELEISRIKQAYKIANEERSKPKPVLDENGSTVGIVITEGYGDNQTEFKVTIDRPYILREVDNRLYLQSDRRKELKYKYPSFAEIDKRVSEGLSKLSNAEQATMREWFEQNKTQIQSSAERQRQKGGLSKELNEFYASTRNLLTPTQSTLQIEYNKEGRILGLDTLKAIVPKFQR